ncbi:hypothetical protein M378DRAFT_662426 [Amanita muscaria Koide BX008]|uniref:Ferric reductase NAD binding domain-containing protein n=1 Tax=Amanita muscaria (strain Koide BX008) TaxID=946122 RepID=A0A0C2X371_AMAMK|nr:hypothetical protein M378DRAFT_662426 [Amanita muscaria Koide BX008]
MTNIIVQDVGADKDTITSLHAPTHFGRPNWDRVFSSIADKHLETDIGVVCRHICLSHRLTIDDGCLVLLWSTCALQAIAHDVQ